MSKSILSTFNMVDVKKGNGNGGGDKVVEARNKMLSGITEQIMLAAEMVKNGVIATQTKAKRVKGADGVWAMENVTFQPRTWFFEKAGTWYTFAKYGNRSLPIQNGKHAIECGASKNVGIMLHKLHEATEMKELDELIANARKRKNK